jgi:hypothetical protein
MKYSKNTLKVGQRWIENTSMSEDLVVIKYLKPFQVGFKYLNNSGTQKKGTIREWLIEDFLKDAWLDEEYVIDRILSKYNDEI